MTETDADTEVIPAWKTVWREGFAPQLSTPALEALAEALARDDPRLLQGVNTQPPPLETLRDWPVEAACALGFCAWQGDGLPTVGDVDDFFGRACFEADLRVHEPAGCRYFLNWFDDTPRDEMRRLLLPEVRDELARRRKGDDA